MDNYLQQLIEFVKNASPMIWATLIRQVYLEAFQYIVWAIVFLAGAFGMNKVGWYGNAVYQEEDWSNWEIGRWVFWGLAAFSVLIAVGFVVAAVSRFINPNFYAIQYIISTLKP